MTKNGIFKNYLYNTSYQLLIIILPLVTAPYVSRILGPENIGAYSYTQSITSYFILFGCIGLNLYGQRECAYNQENIESRSKIFFEIVILKCIMVIVSLVLFVLLTINSKTYKMFLMIQTIELLASALDITWFFQGIEEFKKITIRNFIIKIASVILVFVLIKEKKDIYIYILIYSLSIAFGNISMWLFLRKYISIQYIKKLNIFRHFKPALIIFVPQIATSIYTILDKTMIGFITGDASQVAYYEQAQKIVKLAMAIVTSMGTVMLSRIAFFYNSKKSKEINKAIYKNFDFACFLAFPLCGGLIGISANFIPWFLGSEFKGSILNLIIISPILIFISLSNVIGNQYLLPTMQQKKYTFSVLVGSVINFVCNLILIRYFESVGASISTVLSEFSVTVIQFLLIRNEFSVSKVIINAKNYMVSSLIMLLVVLLIGTLNINAILITILQIFIGAITYIGLLFLIKDKIFDEIKGLL